MFGISFFFFLNFVLWSNITIFLSLSQIRISDRRLFRRLKDVRLLTQYVHSSQINLSIEVYNQSVKVYKMYVI